MARPQPAASAPVLGDSPALAAALRGLINNVQFSDVSFVVGKERRLIHAHRCILACRCKVFHIMFSHQLKTAQSPHQPQVPFVLADMQPDVFLAVIEFVYTNTVTLNSLIALEVLTSAVEYGLDDLRKICVNFISKTLTLNMACEALQAAVTYGQTDLKQRCLAFIEHHTPAVLDVSVSVVAQDVVRELRLSLLSPDELTTLERENAKDGLIPEIQIAQTWKFHALKKVSDSQTHLFHRRKGTLARDHHSYLDSPAK
ncbi:BTB/POZ domain-containing protein 19 isoform X2 [Mixophyes fleayi]|uniref:BTB/POZ domain-containing protein 19 isoform X2 n=1 Tax=Mixophyes fleayi TaxID=3061075 RepID=UPI003F4E4387